MSTGDSDDLLVGEAAAGGAEIAGPVSYGALLRNVRFRRLWWSQFISGIGDWLVIGFLMPLVTELSGGSSFAVAGILIAKVLPSLLLSSFIGTLVDLFDRRRVMIAADLSRAALALVLLSTQWLAPSSPGIALAVIYLTVFLMECASLFFNPAKSSLIPYLVESDELAAANALSYTTTQASMLVGLLSSGAILAVFEGVIRLLVNAQVPLVSRGVGVLSLVLVGQYAGVFLDSLTFLVSAGAIRAIHVKAQVENLGGRRIDLSLVGRDAIESFRFIREHRELRGLLVTIGLAILGGGALVPVGLIYVRENLTTGRFLQQVPVLQRLAATPQTLMLVFMAVGMVAGALIVPRFERRFRLQLLFVGGVTAFGAAMLGFALVSTYWVAGLFVLAAGLAMATVTVAGNTYIVRTTADELRGRVFAALESVVRISLLSSMLLMAPLPDLLTKFLVRPILSRGLAPYRVTMTGSRLTMIFSALVVLAAAWYGFRHLEWRELEERHAQLGREGEHGVEVGITRD